MRKKVGLNEAGNEYLGHLEARAFDPETVRNRTITLKQLRQDIAGEGDILLENITSKHVDRWRAAHPWAPTTANRKVAEVRAFFDWCRARGYMNVNQDPFLGWRNEKVPQASRLRIPVDAWDDVLDAAPHPLERAILACGLFLMARSSELSTIQIKHLDLDASEVEVYRHKVRRYDTLPICSELDAELRRWLTWYSERCSITPDSYLLPNRVRGHTIRDPKTGRLVRLDSDAPIDPSQPIQRPHRHVQMALRAKGYDIAGEGGHTLRRSAARALYDELVEERGYDGALRRVQTMLDHKHSMTTELYLGLDVDKVARNKALRGKPMFTRRQVGTGGNVVPFTRRDGTDG